MSNITPSTVFSRLATMHEIASKLLDDILELRDEIPETIGRGEWNPFRDLREQLDTVAGVMQDLVVPDLKPLPGHVDHLVSEVRT